MSYPAIKKTILILCILLSVFLLRFAFADISDKIVLDEETAIGFDFPDDWLKNTRKNPYDLQYLAKSRRMNSAVFLYHKIDLAKKMSAEKLLQFQVEDLRGKRENFEIFAEEQSLKHASGSIITTEFAAEKDNARNYYKVSVIELDDAPLVYLATIQVSVPSAWKKNKNVLEAILQSAKVLK